MIIGQAPGRRAHESNTPWNDPSGDRLRMWLNLNREEFYDTRKIAITPMGFCYPGKGKSGDLPPPPLCAPTWHGRIRAALPNIELTLLIGQYAHAYYLGSRRKATLGETVRAWREYVEEGFMPLVHPSPRNTLWLRKNPWFEQEIVPYLQARMVVLLK
jgi:uracil-DNA glycosylase